MVKSHRFVGNSSSSMKAMKSPFAFSMALFRVNAMFCLGSRQYLIGVVDEDAKDETTASADRK
jgi:hypothetical protein